MSTEPSSSVPEHLHTVTPRLVVRDAVRAIDFYRAAFAAEELGERFTGPSGELIHAEIRIGDSVIMLTDETDNGAPAKSPRSLGDVVTAIMATYWDDVDTAWQRACRLAPRWCTRWRISSTASGPGGYAIRSGSSGCSASASRVSRPRRWHVAPPRSSTNPTDFVRSAHG